MSHARQQCLAAITGLVTGLPLAGTNVFQSRFYPFEKASLPGRLVRYLPNTESSATATRPAPRVLERTLRVEIVNVMAAVANLDSEIDDLCVEVEKALAMPVAVGPWSSLSLLQTSIDFNVEGEQPCGEARMAYEVVYRIREGAPDVAL